MIIIWNVEFITPYHLLLYYYVCRPRAWCPSVCVCVFMCEKYLNGWAILLLNSSRKPEPDTSPVHTFFSASGAFRNLFFFGVRGATDLSHITLQKKKKPFKIYCNFGEGAASPSPLPWIHHCFRSCVMYTILTFDHGIGGFNIYFLL